MLKGNIKIRKNYFQHFNKYLLNAYYVLVTVLGTEYLENKQIGPYPYGVYILKVGLIFLQILKEKMSSNPIHKRNKNANRQE